MLLIRVVFEAEATALFEGQVVVAQGGQSLAVLGLFLQMPGEGLALFVALVAAVVAVALIGFALVLEVKTGVLVFQHVTGVVEGVVALGGLGGDQLFLVVELPDAGFCLVGVALGVAQRGLQLFGPFDGIAKMQYVVAFVVLEPVEDALFRRQPVDEVKIALVVLDAVFTHLTGVDQVELVMHQAVFPQQGGDDLAHVLPLEDAAVAGQCQPLKVGGDPHLVVTPAFADFASVEPVDVAMYVALQCVTLPEADHRFAVEQSVEADRVVDRPLFVNVKGRLVQPGEALFQL